MTKNNRFKNTLGVFAELVIASALDTEETNSVPIEPSTVTLSLGVGASPTEGDTVKFTFSDGRVAQYTVPASATTAICNAAVKAALEAALADVPGASVGFTGTTTQVITVSTPGAEFNAKTITTTETGSTFTAPGVGTFAGGVNADAAASDNYEDFVANSNAGTIWAFWDDLTSGKQLALAAGDTKKPANINKKFFYAWKDANGYTKRTSSIPVLGLSYDSVAYNAGQAQISKVQYGGTIEAGQLLHIKIIDTTSTQVPYPSYQYNVPFATDIATTCTALAALINAETEDKMVTASASSDTITITGVYKNRTFSLAAFIEVTPAKPTDNSAITFPTSGTQKAIAPVGDLAGVKELEKYYILYGGGINYTPAGTNLEEWQDSTGSNVGTTAQWGFLLVKSNKVQEGIVHNHTAKAHVLVIVPTGSQTTLAAL